MPDPAAQPPGLLALRPDPMNQHAPVHDIQLAISNLSANQDELWRKLDENALLLNTMQTRLIAVTNNTEELMDWATTIENLCCRVDDKAAVLDELVQKNNNLAATVDELTKRVNDLAKKRGSSSGSGEWWLHADHADEEKPEEKRDGDEDTQNQSWWQSQQKGKGWPP